MPVCKGLCVIYSVFAQTVALCLNVGIGNFCCYFFDFLWWMQRVAFWRLWVILPEISPDEASPEDRIHFWSW